jgi:hypothetical protein
MRFLLPAFCALGLCAFAQDEAALETNMKSIGEHAGLIRKLPSKASPDAAAKAEVIASLYDQMKGFWTKRNVSDAIHWSDEGRAAALALAAAAKAGDTAKADASFAALNGTCRSCHTAHREKTPDGKYRIK